MRKRRLTAGITIADLIKASSKRKTVGQPTMVSQAPTDLVELGEDLTHMDVGSFAEGIVYAIEAGITLATEAKSNLNEAEGIFIEEAIAFTENPEDYEATDYILNNYNLIVGRSGSRAFDAAITAIHDAVLSFDSDLEINYMLTAVGSLADAMFELYGYTMEATIEDWWYKTRQ